jgi:hypothetical protein
MKYLCPAYGAEKVSQGVGDRRPSCLERPGPILRHSRKPCRSASEIIEKPLSEEQAKAHRVTRPPQFQTAQRPASTEH